MTTTFEKIINYIRTFIPEYEYSRADFRLVQNDLLEIHDWTFTFPSPNLETLV